MSVASDTARVQRLRDAWSAYQTATIGEGRLNSTAAELAAACAALGRSASDLAPRLWAPWFLEANGG